jgi:hypothetical protein
MSVIEVGINIPAKSVLRNSRVSPRQIRYRRETERTAENRIKINKIETLMKKKVATATV